MKIRKLLLTLLVSVFFAGAGFAQGVTTAAISGRITNANNAALDGATVVAVEIATGTQYGTITNSDGYYHLPHMNVGGPYKLSVTYVGYKSFTKNDIYLTLGQTLKMDASISETTTTLSGVEIVANKNDIFDGNRTGAQTFVSRKVVAEMPSLSGNLNDFTQLTPQANEVGAGVSFAGMNNRYNSVFIDGTMSNDVFGLAANGMNGGQAGVNAISNEAIKQIQIMIAPFDVRQSGFAGASINAVTKNGTNEFKGEAYYKFRNQNLAGKTPGDVAAADRTKLPDFTAKTYGLTLGGPIIKNKLFFFVNAEFQKDVTPQPSIFADYLGNSTQAEIDALGSMLKSKYGYDAGAYLNNSSTLDGKIFLARFDYNISKTQKLMFRYQYNHGVKTSPSRSNSRNIYFGNAGILFPTTTSSFATELKSTFGNKYSNDLKIGYTSTLDDRGPMGSPFPRVSISDGQGRINFGSEVYSTGNKLDQKIFTFTDNFQIYAGKHTITLGTNVEYYNIYNLFIRKAFGTYSYNSLASFLNNDPAATYELGYSLIDNIRGDGSAAAAAFNAMQFGLYAQDEIQVNDNLKITAGLRIDMPKYLTEPKVIPGFNETVIPKLEAVYDMKGAQAGHMPGTQLMFSPRIGFNWDVFGDNTLQVRGGSGIFTSRAPFVWLGGSYTNNGMVIGDYKVYNTETFNPDWQTQSKGPAGLPTGSQIDLYTKNFKNPQMWKTSLAADYKLPGGVVATIDLLYTKTLINVLWKDVNVKSAWGNATGTPDTRPLYKTYHNGIASDYGQIMLGGNTNKGYAYNATFQLRKTFTNNLSASIAYTYGKSESVFDGTSSQNSSQWNYLVSSPVPRNDAQLGVSSFSLGNRIVAYVSYQKEYLKHLRTGISLYYNGQSGQPFSYIYNDYHGYFTNEAYNGPELIYIPANKSDIVFKGTASQQDAQWAALNSFISSDKYLSAHRGSYAQRNASRLPFTNVFNLKLTQDLFVNHADKSQTLQIALDIFNVGNLLNKKWGIRYYAPYGNLQIIKFEKMIVDPGTASTAKTLPTFSFVAPKDNKAYYVNDSGIYGSRWQAMITLRYKFN